MQTENVPSEQGGHVQGRGVLMRRHQMSHFGESVHEYNDLCVAGFGLRQCLNKVHADAFPPSLGDKRGLQQARR